MQFMKTAVLILTAVSAEFAPQTTDIGAPAKGAFNKMLQKLQAGRRLDAHEGPTSAACYAACDGAEKAMQDVVANYQAIEKGDMSALCPHVSALECMGGAKDCKDPKAEEDESGMAFVGCTCACPEIGKIEGMKQEEYCTAGNPMECVSSKTECSAFFNKFVLKGGSKADFDTGMDIHCKKVDLDCYKKGEELGTGECAANLAVWGHTGCEDAARAGTLSEKKGECCAHVERIMSVCYSTECSKLDNREHAHRAKDASAEEKKMLDEERNKNYEIGKVCPASCIPTSDESANDPAPCDPKIVSDQTAKGSWASLPHAILFVAILGALLA
jgi:hypothetical protein